MNQRITMLIQALGLKKVEFAKRMNLSQSFVSELCSGRNNPSDRTISDICREFGVSEVWLRTGEGEMFHQLDPEQELADLFASIAVSDDPLIRRIIRAYWVLDEKEKAAVRKLIDNLSQP